MIFEFRGDYSFLSNFYIEPDGTHVEGEYQAKKCRNAEDVERFKGLSPKEAKKLARHIDIKYNWDDIKLDIMRGLVKQKFMDHASLRAKLLATGYEEIEEGNWWGDHYWGVCGGWGFNWLGKILMDVREMVREI